MKRKKNKDSNSPTLKKNRKFFLTCYSKNCKDMFDINNLICCTRCRKCFHPECNDPPLIYEVVIRYPWHCNKCKLCVKCSENESNGTTLIICDACDRGFHLDCTNDKNQEGNWFCDDCQYCKQCGKRLSDIEATSGWYSIEGNKMCKRCIDNRSLNEIRYKNELCCVCSNLMDFDSDTEDSRIICFKCTQVSHKKCSHPENGEFNKFKEHNRICNNCHNIESWKISID